MFNKKSFSLFAAALFFVACFSSCAKKDYTCNCKMSGTTVPIQYANSTNAEAKDGCNQKETEFINAGHADASCSVTAD